MMDTSISKTAWNKPRKALENTNTSLNISVGLNGVGSSGLKRLSESLTRKTPSKTPRRSPSRLGGKSPSRDGPGISPGRNGGDRFIPNRSTTDFEASHFKLTKDGSDAAEAELMSPTKREYQRVIQENLGSDLSIPEFSRFKPN